MPNRQIKIRYIKSHDYKVALSTGIFGGLGSNGLINANFYIDRVIIPKNENVEIDENGSIVKSEYEREGDAVREVQFGALLDINTAKQIADWLNSKIFEHEQRFKR